MQHIRVKISKHNQTDVIHFVELCSYVIFVSNIVLTQIAILFYSQEQSVTIGQILVALVRLPYPLWGNNYPLRTAFIDLAYYDVLL